MKWIIPILLILGGCGADGEDVVNALKDCDSNVTVTIYKNTWTEGMEFVCEMKPPENKDDS